jgi:hypothetical protein
MIEALEPLRAFVKDLRLGEAGRVTLGGKPVSTAVGFPVPADANADAKRVAALMAAVYEHAYTVPYPPAPTPTEDLAADGNLAEEFARANAGVPRVEPGWTFVEHGPGGSIVAGRNGRLRSIPVGQYMLSDAAAGLQPGAPLVVSLAAGSATRQPGFYFCFSSAFREANDLSPIVRLYFNVSRRAAAPFVGMLTALLNRYGIPFEFKIVTAAAAFARRDKAVLYLSQDQFHVAALAIGASRGTLERMLEEGTPLFTKPLARGIGFAEDAGDGGSFGTARSGLIAAALIGAQDGDGFSWAGFERSFAEQAAAARLNVDALWLNPGSDDMYALPETAVAA